MAETNKILIVSDDETFSKPCVSFYEELGIEVLLQKDGLSALNIVKKEPLEFIIAETGLIYLDGMHLCKIVKSDSRLNHMPFALILESDKPEEMLNARRVGADYSVTKPVDLNVLKDNIINLLYKKQPEDALE
ncbi:uncharacterized protein METZ01_LOCUS50731 [marine metagenome]|uniref:Response regulatory domain-containing protein n=1 Tax=marine metagenome TaxID=408172 RepID=A0A381S6J8_9ZZZZ